MLLECPVVEYQDPCTGEWFKLRALDENDYGQLSLERDCEGEIE